MSREEGEDEEEENGEEEWEEEEEEEMWEEEEEVEYSDEETCSGRGEEEGRRTGWHRRRLSRFEIRCPPGGQDNIVLYVTSLRGIRKTFGDCEIIRELLKVRDKIQSVQDMGYHMIECRSSTWTSIVVGSEVVGYQKMTTLIHCI